MTSRAKILIVDDDELSLEVMQTKLAERYDIVTTNVPGNVVKLARETEPDLILCDFDMPDMDGAEVSERCRGFRAALDPAALPHLPRHHGRDEPHAQADRRATGDLEGHAARAPRGSHQ